MIPSLQPDRSRKYLQNCRNNAKWIDFVILRHFTERTFSLWCEAQRKDSAGKWQNLGKYWMVTVTLENSHFCLNFKSPNFRGSAKISSSVKHWFHTWREVFCWIFVEYYQLFAKSRYKLFGKHKGSICKTHKVHVRQVGADFCPVLI